MHKKIICKLLVVTFCCAALLTACNKGKESTSKESSGGKVLAEVNGAKITSEDFQKELENLPPYLKPMAESIDGRKELLDTMIVRQIVLQEAAKSGIDKGKEVTDKVEDLRKRVIVEAFLKKKIEDEAKISDAELKKFYDDNSEKFKTGDQVKASHILVKSEKEAQDILAKLKSGTPFEELAKKNSLDSTAAKGGDLGWFGKGNMVPEFEKAVFGLKEGELSGVVKTKFGYHIIKVTGKRPAGARPFAEVKEQIKGALLSSRQGEIFKKLKDDLKKSAKIEIKDETLKGAEANPANPATK